MSSVCIRNGTFLFCLAAFVLYIALQTFEQTHRPMQFWCPSSLASTLMSIVRQIHREVSCYIAHIHRRVSRCNEAFFSAFVHPGNMLSIIGFYSVFRMVFIWVFVEIDDRYLISNRMWAAGRILIIWVMSVNGCDRQRYSDFQRW